MTQKIRQDLLVGDIEIDGDATFTGSMIDALVAAGSTRVLTAANAGRTIALDTATGSVVDLPSATGSGAVYKFLVTVEPTSNDHIVRVAAATDDEFIGQLNLIDVDTSDAHSAQAAQAADDFDTITMNATTTGGEVGDWLEVRDIASGVWAVRGELKHTGNVGTPMADGSIAAS